MSAGRAHLGGLPISSTRPACRWCTRSPSHRCRRWPWRCRSALRPVRRRRSGDRAGADRAGHGVAARTGSASRSRSRRWTPGVAVALLRCFAVACPPLMPEPRLAVATGGCARWWPCRSRCSPARSGRRAMPPPVATALTLFFLPLRVAERQAVLTGRRGAGLVAGAVGRRPAHRSRVSPPVSLAVADTSLPLPVVPVAATPLSALARALVLVAVGVGGRGTTVLGAGLVLVVAAVGVGVAGDAAVALRPSALFCCVVRVVVRSCSALPPFLAVGLVLVGVGVECCVAGDAPVLGLGFVLVLVRVGVGSSRPCRRSWLRPCSCWSRSRRCHWWRCRCSQPWPRSRCCSSRCWR